MKGFKKQDSPQQASATGRTKPSTESKTQAANTELPGKSTKDSSVREPSSSTRPKSREWEGRARSKVRSSEDNLKIAGRRRC